MKKNIFTLIGTIAVLFTGCENNTAEDLMSNSTSKSNDIIQLEIQSANDYNIYKTWNNSNSKLPTNTCIHYNLHSNRIHFIYDF